MTRTLIPMVVLGSILACAGGSPPPALVPETTSSAVPTPSSSDMPAIATAATTATTAPTAVATTTTTVAAPDTKASSDFPIPKDAGTPAAAPGGSNKITIYQVPRGRDAVAAEVREALKQGGWTLAKDDPSPSGRAIRLEAKKGDKLYKVSFTGDATRTALILTSP